MSSSSVFSNPSELIKKVRYETEKSRYLLALFTVVIPALILLIIVIIASKGVAIPIIIFYGLLIWFVIWFIGRAVKAALLMNLVEVNEDNFSKVFQIINDTKEILDYKKTIVAYVWSGSQVGLTIFHHLDKKILIIESALLEDNPSEDILRFSIMFHVARLKTKSEYFSILTKIISGIENLWVLNIFLYPFERATVYTADRIAMIYSGQSDYAEKSFSREMVGTELYEDINISRVAEQGIQCRGFFAWLARSYSPTPGYSHRFIELKKFSNNASDIMLERHKP